ncbi:MAG TPA: TonB-dependent receptor [Caulobacteraceae bacterium]
MRHLGGNIHTRLLCGTAAISLLAAAAPAYAEAQTVEFNIPAQSLSEALDSFAAQSRQPILVAPEITRGKATRGVTGAVDTPTALAQLLEGTGLTWRVSGKTYLIESASPQSGSAAGGGAEVEALIVTAQKREEDIQDVPIAMSAFTQEQLERSQVAGGPDLMTQVPNMTFTKTNFTGYSIQIRGIGTQAISATTDNAVAVAFNNTPFIRNRFFEQEFYDLQRVEVLRGPQGTLYGRNATAGVVNLISQKPKFTYEAKISADVANYSSSRLEGMINVPLVEDKVALRIAGAWTKRDGFVTNEITGNPIDGRDLWSTRASLRFTPNDRLDANLIWEHFEENDDRLRSGKQLCKTDTITNVHGIPVDGNNTPFPDSGQGNGTGNFGWAGVQGTLSQGCAPASLYSPDSFEVPNGFSVPYYGPLSAQSLPAALIDPYASTTQSHDLRVIESTVDPRYQAKSDVIEFQFNYDLSAALTLTSETDYSIDEIFSTQDFNRFNTQSGAWDTLDSQGNPNDWVQAGILDENGFFCDPQIGCADRLVGIDVSTARSRHFSQEFRVGSNFDGPFNFSLGANFLRYDTEDKYYVMFNSLTMYAASTAFRHGSTVFDLNFAPAYQAGVTDNTRCLANGLNPPNPTGVESILGCVYIDPNPISSLNDLGHNYFLSRNPYKLISYAAFGEAYYNITDNLKVTAGLRWTVDKKEAPRIPSWVLGAAYAGYSPAEVVRQEWREPTGRLALDWKPDLSFTDQTLVYASYGRGYKAGGMNPPPAGLVVRGLVSAAQDYSELQAHSATHPRTFDAEFVNAYELGTKNTLLDGALTLNLAAFYYDYTGYQISQIVNRSAVNLNFDADVWGLELESDWRPVENFKLGLKLGYEKTKVADGMRAIDTMDRTNGDPAWVVVSPFPTQPSNCVLPTWLFIGDNPATTAPFDLVGVGGQSGGNSGGCELAYIFNQDPVTGNAFTVNPSISGLAQGARIFRTSPNYADWSTDAKDYPCWPTGAGSPAGTPGTGHVYPGVDPECLAALSNNGEGFFKDLSGNELPNAPHMTATITADYTLPLPNDWLVTLHTDLYYQSEAWTRIFNTEGYDKLKAYSNINLAAIFTNEEAGWKVMAYVKNVLDRDSITGAFLNSDDTGLTTNVFLTEPRLYGLRITKDFTGGPWWTGANPDHTGPYPLTVELGGQVQRQDAPYETFVSEGMATLPEGFDATQTVQNRDLDWGDGRSVRISWRPENSPWSVSAGLRYGRTNSDTARVHNESYSSHHACGFSPTRPAPSATLANLFCNPQSAKYNVLIANYATSDFADGEARNHEEHELIDFEVGYDLGVGSLFRRSEMNLGLRHASFDSTTHVKAAALSDWLVPEGWASLASVIGVPIEYTTYSAELASDREFRGAGPTLSWEAAVPLLGDDTTGHLTLDWSVGGGVLFGDTKTEIEGFDRFERRSGVVNTAGRDFPIDIVGTPTFTPINVTRSKSATVPVVDLSLGLSYDVGRVKVGTGYRWERYFDVLDGGFDEAKKTDRTIDGPYFKIAVGFGR